MSRFFVTKQTFPHVSPPPCSVMDREKMETVPGTENMTYEQAKAKAKYLNSLSLPTQGEAL